MEQCRTGAGRWRNGTGIAGTAVDLAMGQRKTMN